MGEMDFQLFLKKYHDVYRPAELELTDESTLKNSG